MTDKAEDGFWTPEITENFDFVKHNKTDFEAFQTFYDEMSNIYGPMEIKKAKEQRRKALYKWDHSLPDRWKEAKLSLIKKPVVAKILTALEKSPRGSFFLEGESGAGKTFVSYALARRFIGQGLVTPSQIKIVSESVIFNWASRGFRGADLLTELFSEQYHLYIFDGIGTLEANEEEKVAPLWEQIIDHCYSKDRIAIFTSATGIDEFANTLSLPGATRLKTLIEDRAYTVENDGTKARKS